MSVSVRTGSPGAALTVEGYERIFSVLEACDGAPSLPAFKLAVIEALHRSYGTRYVTFFSGPSLASAFSDDDAVFPDGSREERLMHEYQSRWRSADPYATRVATERLTTTGVAVLRELGVLPPTAQDYVREFLRGWDIENSAAMRIPLANGEVGLVGLFDRDSARLSDEDCVGLRLLARQLSLVARAISPSQHADSLANVSGRPREVAVLVADGLTNAAIGKQLHLSEDTVKKYVSRALAATGCRSRTELAVLLTTR